MGQLAEKAAGQAGQGAPPPPAPDPEARRAAYEIPLEDEGLDHAIGDQRQKLLNIQRCACVASRPRESREQRSTDTSWHALSNAVSVQASSEWCRSDDGRRHDTCLLRC
jgi:hypothetical protein